MGFMGWDGIGWDAPANASLRFPSAAPAPALSRPAAVRASPQVNVTAGGADSLVTAMCMKALPDWFAFGSARGSESPHTHHPRTHNHAHTRCSLQAGGRTSDGFNAIVNPDNLSYNPDRDGWRQTGGSILME